MKEAMVSRVGGFSVNLRVDEADDPVKLDELWFPKRVDVVNCEAG